jgi:Flp pilus assembly CpaE family ATPase
MRGLDLGSETRSWRYARFELAVFDLLDNTKNDFQEGLLQNSNRVYFGANKKLISLAYEKLL